MLPGMHKISRARPETDYNFRQRKGGDNMSVKWLMGLMIFLALGCSDAAHRTVQGEAPRMTKEELRAQLGSPDLVIVDARYGKDWTDSDLKISGAIREDPKKFDTWKGKYPKEKTLVLYCA